MAKRWYSVSVLSNFEKKIAEQIKTAVADASLEAEIEEVLVPTEEVIEVRRGKKVTTERRFMPGYVLVRMEMSDQGYHLINSINGVDQMVTLIRHFHTNKNISRHKSPLCRNFFATPYFKHFFCRD